MAISTGAAILGAAALPTVMGAVGLGPKGGGSTSQTTTQKATPMPRPSEYNEIWDKFMSQYLGGDYKGGLKTLYDEKREAEKSYLSKLTGIKEPYLGKVEEAMGTHRGLLDEIVNKRMAGEAVGPYAADIDKLLGERTGISFGGADPMQFITGPQQRLLSNLLTAQETGLGGIQQTSAQRAAADVSPAEKRYAAEREIADKGLSQFMPSNVADLAYLQDLRSMIEPMEMARFHATPSTATTATGQMAPVSQQSQQLGNLSQILNLAMGAQGLFGGGTAGQGLIPGSAAQQGIPNVMTIT